MRCGHLRWAETQGFPRTPLRSHSRQGNELCCPQPEKECLGNAYHPRTSGARTAVSLVSAIAFGGNVISQNYVFKSTTAGTLVYVNLLQSFLCVLYIWKKLRVSCVRKYYYLYDKRHPINNRKFAALLVIATPMP